MYEETKFKCNCSPFYGMPLVCAGARTLCACVSRKPVRRAASGRAAVADGCRGEMGAVLRVRLLQRRPPPARRGRGQEGEPGHCLYQLKF